MGLWFAGLGLSACDGESANVDDGAEASTGEAVGSGPSQDTGADDDSDNDGAAGTSGADESTSGVGTSGADASSDVGEQSSGADGSSGGSTTGEDPTGEDPIGDGSSGDPSVCTVDGTWSVVGSYYDQVSMLDQEVYSTFELEQLDTAAPMQCLGFGGLDTVEVIGTINGGGFDVGVYEPSTGRLCIQQNGGFTVWDNKIVDDCVSLTGNFATEGFSYAYTGTLEP